MQILSALTLYIIELLFSPDIMRFKYVWLVLIALNNSVCLSSWCCESNVDTRAAKSVSEFMLSYTYLSLQLQNKHHSAWAVVTDPVFTPRFCRHRDGCRMSQPDLMGWWINSTPLLNFKTLFNLSACHLTKMCCDNTQNNFRHETMRPGCMSWWSLIFPGWSSHSSCLFWSFSSLLRSSERNVIRIVETYKHNKSVV